ncbi:hypothetical protein [Streptomyces sp. NPDC005283]|uniref:hypothetical protein n=1 Tax=Streptomyces sp. NPDC005283 TaxID=3156871 RepID=UPI0034562274
MPGGNLQPYGGAAAQRRGRWIGFEVGLADGRPRRAHLGDSIDDCGHVQGSADLSGKHRTHLHLFRVTANGRQAFADAT